MSEPVKVYLIDANSEAGARVLAIRGLRAALEVLTGKKIGPFAADAYRARLETGGKPVLLGEADDRDTAEEAVLRGQEVSNGSLEFALDLDTDEPLADDAPETPEAPPTPLPGPISITDLLGGLKALDDDYTPSVEAATSAIALMAQNQGVSTSALLFAGILRRTTGDELWDEVARLIISSFPQVG